MELASVREALRAREPLFHREPAGSGRDHFTAMIMPDYWEVGASGERYDRDFVLDVLEERRVDPQPDPWRVEDFAVRHLDGASWLATYVLWQGQRRTRRSTVWLHVDDGPGRWVAAYHQGTLA